MAKFIYKMQNILNIKFKLEDQAKSVYAEAQARLNEEEKKLDVLLYKKQVYEQRLRELVKDSLNIMEIKKCQDAVEVTKYAVKVQRVAVFNADRQLETARIKLNDAMVERKTHEKLKENAFEQFKDEINTEEKKEIDELVSYKYSKTTDSEDD